MNDKILNHQDDGTSEVSSSYAEQSGAAHLHMEQHKNEETSSRADDKDIPDCNIFGSDSQHQDDTLTESETWMGQMIGTRLLNLNWSLMHVSHYDMLKKDKHWNESLAKPSIKENVVGAGPWGITSKCPHTYMQC